LAASPVAGPSAPGSTQRTWPFAGAGFLLHHPVVQIVVRRLGFAIPLLFVVSALTFVLVSLVPGDPAYSILGTNHRPEEYKGLDHTLGFDQPLYDQYWHWLDRALHGNLGASLISKEDIGQMIQERLPVTMSLVVGCLVAISVVGVGIGVAAAVRGGFFGRIVDGLAMLGFALPGFWVGAVLISFFAVRLHWLPAVGYTPLADSPTAWLKSLILPIAALGVNSVAGVSKQTREAMLDALASEHVRIAHANGIPPRTIYFRLALKSAGFVVVTLIGLQAVGLLLGTVFIEQVFALPGLGSVLVTATQGRDLPVVQALTVFFTLMIIAINLIVDLLYGALDPRVRAG
jgi:peptide/nickel transport system permease protein